MSRRVVLRSLVAAVALVLLAGSALAQEGILGNVRTTIDSVASSASTTTTFASGLTTKTDTTNVSPALTVNIDSLLYPNLRLNAGGVFDINWVGTSSNIAGETDSTVSRNRPYFQLQSTSPILAPGFGYFRREDRSRVAGFTTVKLVNDEYAGYLRWHPDGGPVSDFQYLRTNTFDAARTLQDLTKDFATFVSNYSRNNFTAYYRGSYLRNDDQLHVVDTRQTTHAGRVAYTGSHIHKRLLWNATYDVSHQDLSTITGGKGGEVQIPVNVSAGLSSISDTPITSQLTPNPLLIDSNLAASAGIDIGVATPPANIQARNFGIDLLNRVQVNRFLVWVDRQLQVEVANSYSWEIYSSPDNLVWTREASVPVAPFEPFENRFQLDFPAVTARYVKVVVRPLSPVVQDASRYEHVFVTELQPFLVRPADSVRNDLAQTTNRLNTDVRFRILEAPLLFYEGFYLYNGSDIGARATSTLSNGLSATHTFSSVFAAYARAAFEQGTEPRGDRTAAVTNATLTVTPISTVRSSVLYTGQDERIAGVPASRRGVMVQNSAQVYRGVDLIVGFGWNSTNRESGQISHDRLLNASATIVPRRAVSLTFSFDGTTTDYGGVLAGKPGYRNQRFYAAATVDPIPTLRLVLGEEIAAITGLRTRTTLDVGVNWTPFPEGALQLIFATNQAVRALEFGTYRNALGTIRWNFSRRSFIDATYQRSRSEFVDQTTALRTFTVTLRLVL